MEPYAINLDRLYVTRFVSMLGLSWESPLLTNDPVYGSTIL